MKLTLTVLLLIFACSSVARGQAGTTQPPRFSEAEQEVMDAAHEWMDAVKRHDEAHLKRIMADEYTLSSLVNLSRPPVPKDRWIENHKLLEVESFSYDGTRVRVYDDTAMVHTLFKMKGVFHDKPVDEVFVIIDTWVKRNGRWQVASRISGPYTEPQATK